MAWTTPPTKAAGERLPSSEWNQYIRDNLQYLYDRGTLLGVQFDTTNRTGYTTEQDLDGLSITVTTLENRLVRITGHVLISASASAGFVGRIKEGATELGRFGHDSVLSSGDRLFEGSAIVTPTAGSHTYKLTGSNATGGAQTFDAKNAITAAFIMVEDIGPT